MALVKIIPVAKVSETKSLQKKIQEARSVAEYFYLLNETSWNKFDDALYVINRRWFDRWKDFISYDYIVRFLIEQRKQQSDLSVNRIMSNNSNPGEISNVQLFLDRKDYLQLRSPPERLKFCNSPLRQGVTFERDVFLVSEGVWRLLNGTYKGEEIKRYAVYKSCAFIDRSPNLPMVSF